MCTYTRARAFGIRTRVKFNLKFPLYSRYIPAIFPLYSRYIVSPKASHGANVDYIYMDKMFKNVLLKNGGTLKNNAEYN